MNPLSTEGRIIFAPERARRFTRTRGRERVGLIEYDVAGFGIPGERQWPTPTGRMRAYDVADGRISADQERTKDIMGEAT
jgi:hypothetical protein